MQTTATRRVFATLISCMLLVLWIEQHAINAYWQQTFHQPGLLASLSTLPPWQAGDRINNTLQQHYQQALAQVSAQDDAMIRRFRDCCLAAPVPAPVAPPPPARPAAAAKTPQAADPRLLVANGTEVLLAGDSMMQGVAPHLVQQLHRDHAIKSLNLSKQSTGLTYPGFFDWPATISKQLADNPNLRLVIILLGANDTWDMVSGNRYIRFRSPEWEQHYRERIRNIVQAANVHHARLLWLAAPNMGRQPLNDGVHYLNTLYQQEMQAAGQRYITTREVLGSHDDSYSKFMQLPEQGEVTVRTADGVHFTRQGQLLLAQRILAELRFE